MARWSAPATLTLATVVRFYAGATGIRISGDRLERIARASEITTRRGLQV